MEIFSFIIVVLGKCMHIPENGQYSMLRLRYADFKE